MKRSNKSEKGKGGTLDTRPNPWTADGQRNGLRPSVADAQGFAAMCDVLLDAGCALILGATRDGGAVVLTILDGANRHRTYCGSEFELDQAVDAVRDIFSTPTRDG